MECREYRDVSVDLIDVDDRTFLISYPLSDEGLRRSVSRLGVIGPLLLLDRRDDKLQVITGFRRLRACQEVGMKKVPAFVYPHRVDPRDAFRLAIEDNLNRGYNLIERGNVLHKLIDSFRVSHEEVLGDYMPLLGLNPGRALLRDYLSLQGLTEDMRGYVCETEMPLSPAARIASYGEEEQAALLGLLRPLRPGVNKLREILINAEETAVRDNVDLVRVLSREELKAITDSDAPRPGKLELVRAELKRMRFPTVSATEGSIEELLKPLRLTGDITFHLPPYLEGDTVRAELKFKSAGELKRLAEKLMEASDRDELKKIFELL